METHLVRGARMMAQAALRDRQVELTRDLILEAQAGLVADGLLAEFAVHDAADRAGTSLRTVYLPANGATPNR